MRTKDLLGQRFGRLVVLKRIGQVGQTRACHWRCQCDCGATPIVSGANLRRGNSLSCGCLRNEIHAARFRLQQESKQKEDFINESDRLEQFLVARYNNPLRPVYDDPINFED